MHRQEEIDSQSPAPCILRRDISSSKRDAKLPILRASRLIQYSLILYPRIRKGSDASIRGSCTWNAGLRGFLYGGSVVALVDADVEWIRIKVEGATMVTKLRETIRRHPRCYSCGMAFELVSCNGCVVC